MLVSRARHQRRQAIDSEVSYEPGEDENLEARDSLNSSEDDEDGTSSEDDCDDFQVLDKGMPCRMTRKRYTKEERESIVSTGLNFHS